MPFINCEDDAGHTSTFNRVMSVGERPRILVAVQPRLLGSVIAGLLRRADLDEVLESADVGQLDSPADIAIVTAPDDGVDAKVVVQLDPDRGTLTVLDRGIPVRRAPLAGPITLIDLVDELCPAPDGSRRAAVNEIASLRTERT